MPYARTTSHIRSFKKTHQEAQDRIEARGVDCVFCCFDESHSIIHNAALVIPLKALLTGVGSVKPVITKDFKMGNERVFPLARLREWSEMLRSARLYAQCTAEEYKSEVDKLCDPDVSYTHSIVFERPVGVSHRMGSGNSGPWIVDVATESEIPNTSVDQPAVVGPESDAKVQETDDVEITGSYTVGNSSGSGTTSTSRAVATH